jgi:hypothetical protein
LQERLVDMAEVDDEDEEIGDAETTLQCEGASAPDGQAALLIDPHAAVDEPDSLSRSAWPSPNSSSHQGP